MNRPANYFSVTQDLVIQQGQDTAIAWIRSHIGIPGNVKADQRAAYELHLGVAAGSTEVATEKGVRAASRDTRKERVKRKRFLAE